MCFHRSCNSIYVIPTHATSLWLGAQEVATPFKPSFKVGQSEPKILRLVKVRILPPVQKSYKMQGRKLIIFQKIICQIRKVKSFLDTPTSPWQNMPPLLWYRILSVWRPIEEGSAVNNTDLNVIDMRVKMIKGKSVQFFYQFGISGSQTGNWFSLRWWFWGEE